MSQVIFVSYEEIFQHLKLACQIPTILEEIAIRRLINETAAAKGVKVTPEELQQAADTFRLANKIHQAEDTWSWLNKNGLSLDDFEDLIATNTLSSKLAYHLFAAQVEPWFFEHLTDYTGAILYEVLLPDLDLALELYYSLQEGEICFGEIARQYIQDQQQRRMWGYRGLVQRSELNPQISTAVFAAVPPQVLKPIATRQGVHLILVEEIVQPQLDETLHDKILADLFQQWVKQQLRQRQVLLQGD